MKDKGGPAELRAVQKQDDSLKKIFSSLSNPGSVLLIECSPVPNLGSQQEEAHHHLTAGATQELQSDSPQVHSTCRHCRSSWQEKDPQEDTRHVLWAWSLDRLIERSQTYAIVSGLPVLSHSLPSTESKQIAMALMSIFFLCLTPPPSY